MLKVHKYIFNPFRENTYVIWDDVTLESAVIDPGCYDKSEELLLHNFITENNLRLKYIVNTHCHIDHIFGNAYIKNNFDCKLLLPEEDHFMLDLMIEQAKVYGVVLIPSPKPDIFIKEDLLFQLGEIKGIFIHTPGHSPGEYCLYFPTEKICFTGDVLFNESIGRTDLWKGDFNELMKSIKTKLLTLPSEVVIYPGHETESTIKHETENNPFLK